MSQLGGQTLEAKLPRSAIESISFEEFVKAIRESKHGNCIVTNNVSESQIRARLQYSEYARDLEWAHQHADWPVGDELSISTIAAAFYDYRGCRFIGEIQCDGVAFMVRDDIGPEWRVGDMIPGGYLLDVVQIDPTHVIARVLVRPRPLPFKVVLPR